MLLDVEAAEHDVLVLMEQPDVVHQLEALEALHDAGRLGLELEEKCLLFLRQAAAHAAARQLEVVVDVGVDAAGAAPLVEGLEQRGDARVLAPVMVGRGRQGGVVVGRGRQG